MIIYKYLPPNRVTVLSDLEIGFAAPYVFNDPFEMSPVFAALMKPEDIEPFVAAQLAEYMAGGEIDAILARELEEARPLIEAHRPDLLADDFKQLREYLSSFARPLLEELAPPAFERLLGLTDPEVKAKFVDGLFSKMNKTCRVLSLSSDCENILMWSHYADSHRGIVVGLDAQHSFFDQRLSANDPIRQLKKVVYSSERPEFRGFSMALDNDEVEAFADLVLLTKSRDWEYENEWRMVLVADSADRSVGADGEISIFTLPPEIVRCVIVGSRAVDETRSAVADALKANELRDVVIKQARLDPRQYKVHVAEI